MAGGSGDVLLWKVVVEQKDGDVRTREVAEECGLNASHMASLNLHLKSIIEALDLIITVEKLDKSVQRF
jgi:hypothetical protein